MAVGAIVTPICMVVLFVHERSNKLRMKNEKERKEWEKTHTEQIAKEDKAKRKRFRQLFKEIKHLDDCIDGVKTQNTELSVELKEMKERIIGLERNRRSGDRS